MFKSLYLATWGFCWLVVCAPLLAADPVAERLESSPRHHEWVEIPGAGGREIRGFLVFPEVDHAATGVVVIHENRGLTDWVRGVADQLAEAGYVALAPDLLSGTGPAGGATESYETSDAAREAIYKLDAMQVLADLDASVAYLREQPATTETIAIAGFCWGGGQAFRYAAHSDQVAASFVFYGSAPDADALGQVAVPVYGFYGGNDFRITGAVPMVAEHMKSAGKTFEPVVYEGAGHGFLRSGEAAEASAADRTAREQAWERWKEILGGL